MDLKGTLTVLPILQQPVNNTGTQTQPNKAETTKDEAPQSAAQTEALCLSLKQICAAFKAILPDVLKDLDTCGSAVGGVNRAP